MLSYVTVIKLVCCYITIEWFGDHIIGNHICTSNTGVNAVMFLQQKMIRG